MAPYAGSLAGPGPMIGNIPVIRTITPALISTDTGAFTNLVASSIEIKALSFTFGPTFSLRQGPLEFSVSGGVTCWIERRLKRPTSPAAPPRVPEPCRRKDPP